MQPIDHLLESLDKCRPNGQNKWTACCPSHNDKTPSLAIRLDPDDRILIHCFAGCTAADVCAAVAFDIGGLMPPDNSYMRKHLSRADQMSQDEWVLWIAKADRKAGRPLSAKSKAAEHQAFNRQRAAR